MRLGLIVPRADPLAGNPGLSELWAESPALRSSSFFAPMPSLGLLTVAALVPPGWAVEVQDENLGPLDLDRGYDAVGITAMTFQAQRAYALAAEARARDIRVILGGIHATVLPQEASAHADAVVVGEAEGVWPLLLDDLRAGRLAPLYRAPARADLSLSPVPRYDLVPAGAYPVVPVQTSRGCPRDCEFCSISAVHGRTVRHKGVGQVLAEVAAATRGRGRRRPRVFFADDNLLLDRDRASELLRALTALRVNWMTQCDVSVADDPELLRLVRESGGSQLLVGFESLERGSLEGLDPVGWKARRLERYADSVRTIQAQGIRVLGMFMVGLDGDTPETFGRILEFARRTRLHDAQVTFPTPLPGTRLRERLEREGRLSGHRSWEECSFFRVTFTPAGMSREALEAGHRELYRELLGPELQVARARHFVDVLGALDRPGGDGAA